MTERDVHVTTLEDENGGHGYIEHAAIGNAIVHVFYADDNEEDEKRLLIDEMFTMSLEKNRRNQ